MVFDKYMLGRPQKGDLVAYFDKLQFFPELHSHDGHALISVFEENSLNTISYRVPLNQIGVTILAGGDDNETKIQIVGIETSVIKYARQATILVPPAYKDDVLVWAKHLTRLKKEHKAWLADRPRPRRVLPPKY